MSTDAGFMRRALELAVRGAGDTNPNPMVGCVVVKGGRVVGEGWHHRAGLAHAERVALEDAGEAARGATLYVNLEPCAHEGRTPPCAPLVASAGVKRVVIAMRDPNPLVNGRGVAVLRRAGLEVTGQILEDEALVLNERFVIAVLQRRPFVLLKAAVTLDGRMATSTGDSKWITAPDERRQARRLRRIHDAVAVGVGTAIADDPRLLPDRKTPRDFVRVVFDSELRLPPRSQLLRTVSARAPVWVLCREDRARAAARRRLEEAGATVLTQPVAPADRREKPRAGDRRRRPRPVVRDRVRLSWALREMHLRGVDSLMVEGGAELLGEFLHRRLFDELALFRAPLLLGGRDSVAVFGGASPRRIADALRLAPVEPRPLWAEGTYELWHPRPRM